MKKRFTYSVVGCYETEDEGSQLLNIYGYCEGKHDEYARRGAVLLFKGAFPGATVLMSAASEIKRRDFIRKEVRP